MMDSIYCKYHLLSIAFLMGCIIGSTIIVDCSYQFKANYVDNEHKHDTYTGANYQKRQTGGQSDKSYQTTTYKKTTTTQQDDQSPIETKYSWTLRDNTGADSSPPNSQQINQPTSNKNNDQYSEEIIRRITTTITEEKIEDNNNDNNSNRPNSNNDSTNNSNNQPVDQKPPKNVNLPNMEESRIFTNSLTTKITTTKDSLNGEPHSTVCPANTYGDVLIGCRKCNCNNNIDITDMDNCDRKTGRCLKCLYNTEGHNCERCKSGYTGDATKQQCHLCVCNKLGTNPDGGACSQLTGQCPCLPHVTGLDCGKCQPNYYKFSSGKGCEACNCDQQNSMSQGCNDLDGACECKPGFGGRRCDECADGTFGDPKQRCKSCQCNREGSISQVCDTKSGACRCLPGIGGPRCDRCARGYIGRWPNCEPCGECFQQWDKIVQAMRNETQALLDKVRLLMEIGTVGVYGKEFANIEAKLDRIMYILDNQKLDPDTINYLARQILELSNKLKEIERLLDQYEKDEESIRNRTNAVRDALREMNIMLEVLVKELDILKDNASKLHEASDDGAYASILASQNKTREAEKMARDAKEILLQSEQKRRTTENMLTIAATRYNASSAQNEALLALLARKISELESNIPGINQQVCASNATINTCDQLCGGAGCNKCGGLSCSEGATTRASNALEFAQQAMALIQQKYNMSLAFLDRLGDARNRSQLSLTQSKLVMSSCEASKSKFDKVANDMGTLLDDIEKFSMLDGTKPAEVRVYGTECLQLQISLKPGEILDLAKKINDTINSLINIDLIFKATSGDANTAEQLHQQADRAKELADNILEKVEQVLEMLRLAAMKQKDAAEAIANAEGEMDGAQEDLARLKQQADYLNSIIRRLEEAIKRLRDRLDKLRQMFAQNEHYVSKAEGAVQDASKLADQADKDKDELEDKVKLAASMLLDKTRKSGELKDRAERLKNEAYQLAADILAMLEISREIDDTFDEYERRIKDYQDLIDDLHRQMDQYIKDIDLRAQFYRECQA